MCARVSVCVCRYGCMVYVLFYLISLSIFLLLLLLTVFLICYVYRTIPCWGSDGEIIVKDLDTVQTKDRENVFECPLK